MHKTLIAILLSCHFLMAENFVIKAKKPKTKVGELLCEVKNGEISLKSNIIKNIVLTDKVTVAYKNLSKKEMKPRYHIHFYNAYGLLLGKDEVGKAMSMFGASTYMKPNEIASERLYFDWYPIESILKYSDILIPDDFTKAKWVVISNSNTSVAKASILKSIELNLNEKKQLLIQGKKIKAHELSSTLETLGATAETKIVLSCSRNLPYKTVIDIYEDLKKLGLSHISFKTAGTELEIDKK